MTAIAGGDRELQMLAVNLRRLVARVEARLNPDSVEGVPSLHATDELRAYAISCLAVLDDPEVIRRLASERRAPVGAPSVQCEPSLDLFE